MLNPDPTSNRSQRRMARGIDCNHGPNLVSRGHRRAKKRQAIACSYNGSTNYFVSPGDTIPRQSSSSQKDMAVHGAGSYKFH